MIKVGEYGYQYTEAELRKKIHCLARRRLGLTGDEAIVIVRNTDHDEREGPCDVWDLIDGWAFLLPDDPRAIDAIRSMKQSMINTCPPQANQLEDFESVGEIVAYLYGLIETLRETLAAAVAENNRLLEELRNRPAKSTD